jgi:hypothetical protein
LPARDAIAVWAPGDCLRASLCKVAGSMSMESVLIRLNQSEEKVSRGFQRSGYMLGVIDSRLLGAERSEQAALMSDKPPFSLENVAVESSLIRRIPESQFSTGNNCMLYLIADQVWRCPQFLSFSYRDANGIEH